MGEDMHKFVLSQHGRIGLRLHVCEVSCVFFPNSVPHLGFFKRSKESTQSVHRRVWSVGIPPRTGHTVPEKVAYVLKETIISGENRYTSSIFVQAPLHAHEIDSNYNDFTFATTFVTRLGKNAK